MKSVKKLKPRTKLISNNITLPDPCKTNGRYFVTRIGKYDFQFEKLHYAIKSGNVVYDLVIWGKPKRLKHIL